MVLVIYVAGIGEGVIGVQRKIVIIGAGPGGYVAAVRAAEKGAEVTVIEKDRVGGTCLNWGCIPSKVMIHSAELLEKIRSAPSMGLKIDGPVSVDMKALMARKRNVIDVQAQGLCKLLEHHKVRLLQGSAKIHVANLVEVTDREGTISQVPWDRLVLAPGSRPFQIPSLPFDGKRVLSSNDALNLETIPESILIVGGGVIGCEFAFMLQALGAKVTLVEAMGRIIPLPSVDEDCSKTLLREMKKKKITVLLNRTVQKVESRSDRLKVTVVASGAHWESSTQEGEPVMVDQVLVCVGRTPNTDDLGLETIGVYTDDKGWIPVDERMATNVAGVYAIGDVLGPAKAMLAHVASAEGAVAAENATGGEANMDYSVVPNAIFTMPEVATVGLTEHQAREKGLPVSIETILFRNLGKAHVMGDIAGAVKLIAHGKTGKILGVHIVGLHATDLIAEGALAVRTGCTARELAETIHAHPTLAEIMQEGANKLIGRPLHG
jgi:dihydrolipoamide dehydrogenase